MPYLASFSHKTFMTDGQTDDNDAKEAVQHSCSMSKTVYFLS